MLGILFTFCQEKLFPFAEYVLSHCNYSTNILQQALKVYCAQHRTMKVLEAIELNQPASRLPVGYHSDLFPIQSQNVKTYRHSQMGNKLGHNLQHPRTTPYQV